MRCGDRALPSPLPPLRPLLLHVVVCLLLCQAAKVPVEWEHHVISTHAVTPSGDLISQEALDSVKRNKVGLKGPFETPIGKGHRSLNLTLRKALSLYANVRPCKSVPGLRTKYDDVDVVTIRENTEGEYSGLEHEVRWAGGNARTAPTGTTCWFAVGHSPPPVPPVRARGLHAGRAWRCGEHQGDHRGGELQDRAVRLPVCARQWPQARHRCPQGGSHVRALPLLFPCAACVRESVCVSARTRTWGVPTTCAFVRVCDTRF